MRAEKPQQEKKRGGGTERRNEREEKRETVREGERQGRRSCRATTVVSLAASPPSVAPPPHCVAAENRDAKERRPRVTVLEASVLSLKLQSPSEAAADADLHAPSPLRSSAVIDDPAATNLVRERGDVNRREGGEPPPLLLSHRSCWTELLPPETRCRRRKKHCHCRRRNSLPPPPLEANPVIFSQPKVLPSLLCEIGVGDAAIIPVVLESPLLL
ncbi:uncharacterized protein DS421_17g575730 [Arachis hypogaea]|nr:uncharacterized protein DS421_17g575730 [Arachis hypogaea]